MAASNPEAMPREHEMTRIPEPELRDEAACEGEIVRRQALESTSDAVFAIDREYRLLFNNQQHQHLLAISGGSPLQPGETVLLPDDSTDVLSFWRAAYDRALSGENFRLENEWTDREGRRQVYENKFSPLRDANGMIIGVLIVAHDVTDRKRTEEALKASEERYRAVVEDQTEVINRFRADGTILFANECLCRLLGKTSEELIGHKWQPEAFAEDVPSIEAKLRTLSPSNPVVTIENRIHAANGEVRWMQFVNRAFYDSHAHLIEIQSVGRDITERKRAEEALRKSEAGLRTAERIAAIGHWFLDITTYEITWSDQMYALFGLDPQKGPPSWPDGHKDIVHPDDWKMVLSTVSEAVASRHDYELTCRFHRPDGTTGHLRVIGQPLRGSGPEIREFIGIIQDITKQKILEEERAAATARLAVVEQMERHRLSRELHDQTTQKLVALSVELKNLETNLAAGRPQGERVRALRKAVDDLQQQVRQIALDLRADELAENDWESAFTDYAEQWSERTQIPVDFEYRGVGSRRLPPTVALALYRVAQEALANVEKHAEARHVSVLFEHDPSVARLTVEDDGRGFDADAAQRSSLDTQRLGLLGMRERVTLAGGTFLIESTSESGSGTTILARIPIAAAGQPT